MRHDALMVEDHFPPPDVVREAMLSGRQEP